ncbi:UNKNOWN [Stylonychia lemnae]|uniref:Uncharacterized protein n=1 Tax=Stylonychia lemnae TaxID=5949 RepID=A0A078A2D3_STYLE|nr:UNKNOWN [Stylonychia lemnae]|eukprot:CDW76361.1 UNKNOWN [Stylonychia lemnae]
MNKSSLLISNPFAQSLDLGSESVFIDSYEQLQSQLRDKDVQIDFLMNKLNQIQQLHSISKLQNDQEIQTEEDLKSKEQEKALIAEGIRLKDQFYELKSQQVESDIHINRLQIQVEMLEQSNNEKEQLIQIVQEENKCLQERYERKLKEQEAYLQELITCFEGLTSKDQFYTCYNKDILITSYQSQQENDIFERDEEDDEDEDIYMEDQQEMQIQEEKRRERQLEYELQRNDESELYNELQAALEKNAELIVVNRKLEQTIEDIKEQQILKQQILEQRDQMLKEQLYEVENYQECYIMNNVADEISKQLLDDILAKIEQDLQREQQFSNEVPPQIFISDLSLSY